MNRVSATPTNATSLQWAVTFSEAVTGVDTGDFVLTPTGTAAGTIASVSGTDGTATRTVTVNAVTGNGTLRLDVAVNGTILSVSTSEALATAFTGGQTYSIDNTAPTVSSITRAGASPTGAASVSWTVTFGESVTGVDSADFSLAVGGGLGGAPAISGVSGSGTAYTVISSTGSGSGTLGLNLVDNDTIVDAAGNPLGGAGAGNGNLTGEVYTIDRTGPTVQINQAAGQADPTNGSPVTFTVLFNAAVTGFGAPTDVVISGTAAHGAPSISGSGTTYTVSVPVTGSGTVIADVPPDVAVDAGSHPNLASTSTDHTVTFDNVAPTPTVNRASGQADPTATSPISFSVVFSESVTGFAIGDISLSSSTAGGSLVPSLSGSGTTYTVSVTGMTTAGNVVLTVATGAASDAAGNTSAAPTNTDNSVAWDPTAGPTVTINQASTQADPTSTSPINFTVIFSASVTGFGDQASDVTLGGTAGATTVVVTGSGTTYNVAVSGMTTTGTVTASIPADAALSTAGSHPSRASTSTDNSVTFRIASKWIVTTSASTVVPGGTVTISAQLADVNGTAIPTSGTVVTWSKTGTGGSFATATSTTNSSGIATVSFTVSTIAGTVHTVTASGASVTGTSPNITVQLNPASLSVSSTLLATTYRQFVTLTVQFASSGANRAVQLQRLSPVDSTWVTIANLTTGTSGTATFNYGPPYNTQFRANFVGATDLGAATSTPIRVLVRNKLTFPAGGTTRHVRAGTRLTYTATVRPLSPAGNQRVTFLIYKRVAGVWAFRTSATVRVNAAGQATFSWRWTGGQWYIRARGNATVYNAASLSAIARVTVP